MVVIVGGSVTEDKEEQPSKTPRPSWVIFGGIIIEAKDEQPSKILLGRTVIVDDSITFRREVQS